MAQKIVRMQTAFTAGELDPALKGRRDTALYYLGCERLRNWLITPQGGVVRRPATRSFGVAAGEGWRVAALIDRTAGTRIGNMTDGGGLAGAFDGITDQTNDLAAKRNSVSSATIGKDWGSGNSRIISGFRIWPATDAGFLTGGHSGESFLVKLQGSTDNFAASIVDLAIVNFDEEDVDDDDDALGTRELFGSAIDITTAYRYHRLLISFGEAVSLLVVGDAQSNGDVLLLAGDAQSGGDTLLVGADGTPVDLVVAEVEFYEDHPLAASTAILLASFVFGLGQEYLIAFTDLEVRIWNALTGSLESVLATPWPAADLPLLRWTQVRDTMIVTHPDHEQRAIVRLPTTWTIELYRLRDKDNLYIGPFQPFQGFGVTIDPSGVGPGSVTVVTSKPHFVAEHVEIRLKIRGVVGRITAVTNSTTATVDLLAALSSASATADWSEQAFSPVRGFPRSVGFYHQRLVFGGSRDVPNRIWLSRIGEFKDFTLGEGENDDGISYDLATGQVHEIMHVTPGRGGLEVFLRGEEGVLPASDEAPITPRTVSFHVQTRYGSGNARPTNIDGATLFLQRGQGTVREFLWAESERGYIASSLSIRAAHLIRSPVAIDAISDGLGRQMDMIFVVNVDGEVAIFTTLRAQQITAWSSMLTRGSVRSLAVVGDQVFMAVEREGVAGDFVAIEVLDPAAKLDASVTNTAGSPTVTWPDLQVFAGQSVDVIADGLYLGAQTVSAVGTLTLEVAASEIEVGYDFTPEILPMPLEDPNNVLMGRPMQVYRVVLRVQDAAGLVLEAVGKGGRVMSRSRLPTLLFDEATDAPVPGVSGQVERRLIGWDKEANCRVTQEGPFPAQVLSMMLEVAVGA